MSEQQRQDHIHRLESYMTEMSHKLLTGWSNVTTQQLQTAPEEKKQEAGGAASKELNGVALYTANCQSCHQENGEGLPGAFPPLKGSKVVTDNNPELMVNIIMLPLKK